MKPLLPVLLSAALMASSDVKADPLLAPTPVVNSNPATMLTPPPADLIVAKARGFEIRWSDMEKVFANVRAGEAARGTMFPNQPTIADQAFPRYAQIQVLNQLIEIQLVLQKASAADKAAGKKQGDQTFAKILNGIGPPEMTRRLSATGMTADELHTKFIQEATAQLALTDELGITVTDAEVQSYFESNHQVFDQPEKAHIRRILLYTTVGYSSDPLPADKIAAKRQEIGTINKRVLAGEDFAALARQYSEDPFSKNNGGEVPPFARNASDLGDAAFSLKTNAVSDIITNIEGYNIIQLVEIIPPEKARFADFADKIKKGLLGAKKRELAPAYLEKLKKEAGVEILDPEFK